MSNDFLTSRATTYAKVAKAYADLANLCQSYQLTPLSGDIMDANEWQQHVDTNGISKQTYCPDKEGGIVLKYKDVVVCVLHVNSDGTYFGTTRHGGNHDWNIGELKIEIRLLRLR